MNDRKSNSMSPAARYLRFGVVAVAGVAAGALPSSDVDAQAAPAAAEVAKIEALSDADIYSDYEHEHGIVMTPDGKDDYISYRSAESGRPKPPPPLSNFKPLGNDVVAERIRVEVHGDETLGVYVDSEHRSLTVRDSTIDAYGKPPSVDSPDYYGAAAVYAGTLNIENSTVHHNYAAQPFEDAVGVGVTSLGDKAILNVTDSEVSGARGAVIGWGGGEATFTDSVLRGSAFGLYAEMCDTCRDDDGTSPSIRVQGGVVQGGMGANNVAVVATGSGKVAIENAELLGASGMYATFGAQVDMKGGRILAHNTNILGSQGYADGPYGGVVVTEDGQVNLEGAKVSATGLGAAGLWLLGDKDTSPRASLRNTDVHGEVAAIALGFNGEANISGGSLSVEDGAVLTTLTPDAVEYYYDYALSMEHLPADAPLTPVRVTLSDGARASGETLIAHGGLLPMTLRLSSGVDARGDIVTLPPSAPPDSAEQPDAEPEPDAELEPDAAAQSDAKANARVMAQVDGGEPVAVPIPAPSHPDAPIDVFIDSGAQWRGMTKTVNALRIEDGTWTVTGSSTVNSLHLQAGMVAYATPAESDGEFKHLRVKTLSGSGLFEMNASADLSDGDLLVVSDEASGQHKVLVRGAGTEPTGVESLTLVELPEGSQTKFTLANRGGVVDAGAFRYRLTPDNGVWGLERTSQLSAVANAALNTGGVGAASSIWYAEGNALSKRLGELRLDPGAGGFWGRTFAQKQQLDNKAGRRFDQKVYGFELGADHAIAGQQGRWHVGGLLGYTRARRSFIDDGAGHTDSAHIGAYAAYVADNGFYFDSTLRASRFENDFTVTATDAVSVRGKYRANGVGATLEAGKRFTLHDGWFVEPQSEVSLFHASGGTYRAANNLSVKDEGGTSAVLRLGLAAGRRIDLGKDRVIQPYATLSWLQEFKGVTTVRTNGYGLRTDLSGGRAELALGLAAALGRGHQLYTSYEYAKGNKLTLPWTFHLGYRYTW
ncbi:autotransporter BapC [Bordetella pertussis]|uniref:autotransporter BapC n=1 Tax=Bordetella pertussis TaxID=520 RepID=UPI0009B27821|nr:autotransporter BapC [Bordetella pertussis]